MGYGLGYSIVMSLKVILLFVFIYIFIPAKIARYEAEDKTLDKLFIALIYSNIITIILVHILAFSKLYETMSLLLLYFATYIVYVWIKGRSPSAIADAIGMNIIINLLDMSERKNGFKGELFGSIKQWLSSVRIGINNFRQYICINPLINLITFFVLLAAVIVRFSHSIIHAYYCSADAYVHLVWSKYLGTNMVYKDGIYPAGYQALISAMNKLTFIDSYFIVRYLGPIAGVLIVISIYYFIINNYKSKYACLIALLIYGIVTDNNFPSAIWRQMTALSQEYATIFLLPGIHFLNLYLKKENFRHLNYAGMCLCLTLLIHPHVSFIVIICYSVFIICYSFSKPIFLFKTSKIMVGYGILGILPIIIGLLSGKRFVSTLTMSNLSKFDSEIQKYSWELPAFSLSAYEPSIFLRIFLICVISFLLYSLFLLVKYKIINDKFSVCMTIISLIIYIIYISDKLGLPVVIDSYRTGMFLSIFCVIIYGSALTFLTLFAKRIKVIQAMQGAIFAAVLVLVLLFTPIRLPQGFCFEYDEAAEGYLRIKNSFPGLNWTIISPVEQYQQVLGYGWHYDLYTFVQKISSDELEDKNFAIPTDYIFIFAEKIPLVVKKMDIQQNANNSVTEVYYRNSDNRKILEEKIYNWAEEYMKKHKNMEVFYDGQYLKIYIIKQDGKKPVRLFS